MNVGTVLADLDCFLKTLSHGVAGLGGGGHALRKLAGSSLRDFGGHKPGRRASLVSCAEAMGVVAQPEIIADPTVAGLGFRKSLANLFGTGLYFADQARIFFPRVGRGHAETRAR